MCFQDVLNAPRAASPQLQKQVISSVDSLACGWYPSKPGFHVGSDGGDRRFVRESGSSRSRAGVRMAYARPCAADIELGMTRGLSKSWGSSLFNIVRSFVMFAFVTASPITAISSARVNSEMSNEVTSGASTKSAGCTPTEFILKP